MRRWLTLCIAVACENADTYSIALLRTPLLMATACARARARARVRHCVFVHDDDDDDAGSGAGAAGFSMHGINFRQQQQKLINNAINVGL